MPVAVRHVGHVHDLLGAGHYGTFNRLVGESDVEIKRGAAQRKRFRRPAQPTDMGLAVNSTVLLTSSFAKRTTDKGTRDASNLQATMPTQIA